jgi:asparagine synthase (glutamine-hydrolysing)
MCGITGGWTRKSYSDLEAAVPRMTERLKHRGPDDSGSWSDASCGVGLGHRRLSIIDLSPQGHQPMLSATGRYVLVFNGEIYNHASLRRDLERNRLAPVWRGHSDTEVLVAAIEAWGLSGALKRCTGMFAIGIWDRSRRELSLARDRMGEKPLYYGLKDGTLLFASELKALSALPGVSGEVSRSAITLLLRHNYIPAPYSIYCAVAKVLPGTILTFTHRHLEDGTVPPPQAYWSLAEAAERGDAHPFTGTDDEAVEALESLVACAVAEQVLADVPLGAFLSGGVDSSTIVALMQARASQPVRTFTIGFHESAYNEAGHAHAVARHLGTEHTELYLTEKQALTVVPLLPTLYDEPFADSSQIPTFLVSQLARKHVTVSLSGDGGDELFGGYTRYKMGDALWRAVGWIPRTVRAGAANCITAFPPETWDALYDAVSALLPGATQHNVGNKAHKLADLLSVSKVEQIYRGLVSHWKQPSEVVVGGIEPMTALNNPARKATVRNFIELMMYLDQISYLPDDILVKVDRAAMGVSLETRMPLLDHRVVEFSWTLPASMRLRRGETKWALRQVLYKRVPRSLIERPKSGFAVPLEDWLRGALRDWAEELLSESRLKREGYLYPASVRAKWQEHLSGKRNWAYHLWDVLMFQAWLENQAA